MNGKGYYIYEKGGKPKPDPSVQRVIEEYRKGAKTMPGRKVLLSRSSKTWLVHILLRIVILPPVLIEKYPGLTKICFLQPVTLTDQDILEMIFFPVVNEACRVMDENVVIRASDLDIASVLGMGFPKYRYSSF